MKKIINGKLYDTETAKKIGFNWYSHPGQLNYWCETLYHKKNGEYFLYGEGGANSRYSKEVGPNEWSGGWKIRSMTGVEARVWAKTNMNKDEYMAAFGTSEK